MTTSPPTPVAAPPPTPPRIAGPAELLQAIPYLLGFHPQRSLVLIGLCETVLVVTARLDLEDCVPAMIEHTVQTLCRAGSTTVIGAVFDDAATPVPLRSAAGDDARREIQRAADAAGVEVTELLLVAGRRWRSLLCSFADCCPPEGQELPVEVSAFAADAAYRGVVALPDRAAVEHTLDPLPSRERLLPALEHAEDAALAATLGGRAAQYERSVKRAVFAAARSCGQARWPGPDDAETVRLGFGLNQRAIRDAVWFGVDDRRLDGRPLWRELARRLPAPYDAPALFLFGWASWRAGDGALAGIAADRAMCSDAGYEAADLLRAAVAQGVDPRRMPKLAAGQRRRLPRSA